MHSRFVDFDCVDSVGVVHFFRREHKDVLRVFPRQCAFDSRSDAERLFGRSDVHIPVELDANRDVASNRLVAVGINRRVFFDLRSGVANAAHFGIEVSYGVGGNCYVALERAVVAMANAKGVVAGSHCLEHKHAVEVLVGGSRFDHIA